MEHIFKYFLADKWEVENRKLNNYVHSNGKKYLTDNYVHPGKTEKDKELIETMNNIVDIFLSVLIMIDLSLIQIFKLGMTETTHKRDDNIERRNIHEISDQKIA